MIEIKDLTFKRGNKTILNKINITIPKGKIVAIMGPSGCGKTTLLKLIGGQLLPQGGKVLFEEQEVAKLNNRDLYRLRRRMGMLFQSGALFTNLNVFENVAFPLRAHTRLNEKLLQTTVLLKLEAVGLRGAKDLMPAELSGGMSRRVALARALALDPELMMFDEPFTGQDPITLGVLVQLIKKLNESLGLTSIIVSHDVPETASIADYIYVISKGEIIGEGKPDDVLHDTHPAVKQFIQGLPDGVIPFHYPASDYLGELFND